MNLLIPIEVRGLGTPEVESLPSYIHRLAFVHKVTVSVLLKKVVNWYKLRHEGKSICYNDNAFAGDLSVYVRPNQGTFDLVTMLSEAVGVNNLFGTTFISLKKAIVRTPGIFSKNIRWCPLCMYKSKIYGDDGYFKLIWSVESITHCYEHNALLVDKCPVCKQRQGGYGYKSEPGKCQKCGSSLSKIDYENMDFKPSWTSQGSDMMNLVNYISKHPTNMFPENSVKNVIAHEFDKAWNSNTEEKLWKIIPKNECIGIYEGNIPITLKRARILAYRFGVDLDDLLSGDISKSPLILDDGWCSSLPVDVQPMKKKKYHNKDIVIRKIHDAMKFNKNKPKPLQFYATKTNVSTGYLQYNFPILAERIVSVFKEWKEQEKRRKKHEAYDEALKCIVNYDGPPEEFSKKGALRKIRESTDLPKDVVRKAINDVYSLVLEGKI